ncbi:MAG TPA: 3-hydroxyanthranilate 3,4-dioxygenase [Saprospiraceae bacterium]|nr:3-hydroxyanthranilate 3,4-dioxygenase [Saprospiraceae bacterium]HQW56778.1 3-hydroxyanthranilate 3,4-dioxygenase [Saprospiraceae bacterium]
MISKPFNVYRWIEENKDLLRPPVGNKQIYEANDDFIVMVVGGPNGRKDYHYEEGEELFFQLKGDITVRIINEAGKREDIAIREGEMFLLPARVPHSPQRPEGTVGLVIERYRSPDETDKLLWFCEQCDHKLFQAGFPLEDIGVQIKEAIVDYNAHPELHICEVCGHVN